MNRKLTNGSFSEILQAHQEYEVTRDQSGPLAAELQRLRALGLIEGHGIMDFCKPDRQKRKINEWFRLSAIFSAQRRITATSLLVTLRARASAKLNFERVPLAARVLRSMRISALP
jgi:hypothetical protein